MNSEILNELKSTGIECIIQIMSQKFIFSIDLSITVLHHWASSDDEITIKNENIYIYVNPILIANVAFARTPLYYNHSTSHFQLRQTSTYSSQSDRNTRSIFHSLRTRLKYFGSAPIY